jgi:putative hydrolase of the HAD superfamily
MIRAVLFDLFETLVTEAHASPERAGTLGPRLGLDAAAFRREWIPLRREVTLGRRAFSDVIRDIGASLGSLPSASIVDRIREDRVHAKATVIRNPDPRILELLDELLCRGKKIAVISNCFPEDVATWVAGPLASRIDVSVFSFELGTAKPDPAMYLDALRRLGERPEVAIFVGDGADDELSGADLAGIRAFRAAWFVKAPSAEDRFPVLRSPEELLALPQLG